MGNPTGVEIWHIRRPCQADGPKFITIAMVHMFYPQLLCNLQADGNKTAQEGELWVLKRLNAIGFNGNQMDHGFWA